jgi:arylsulfatase A-like enzyme
MKRPNIVFVVTDDQGYGDLGCHGNEVVRTPAIDAFAARAARFTQFHVGTTCAPSRAGILTGMNCNSAGVWHTIGGASLLRKGLDTLPGVLARNGYATGLFGKWHLGDDYPFRPHDRGFRETVYHRGGGLTQVSDHWGNDYFDDTFLVNGKPRRFKGYCTDVFFGEAFKFIRKHRREPFCCFITPNAPHTPLNVETKWRDPYADADISEERRRFYGMITNIDDNFGRLEKLLHGLKLEDDTILIFMTDNGSASGCETDDDQFVTRGFNAGMRGKKGSPFEGGHRVPFFLRYPAGRVTHGRDIPTLASYTDFMPTLLDLCGVRGPAVEGRSLRPLLDGTKPARDFSRRAIIADTQRIPYPIKWRLSSVMKGDWRLINGRELFDIATDPEQRIDVAASHPKIVRELRADYERWWALCSRQLDEASPVHVGSAACPRVDLTTQELRNEDGDVVFHQGQVRSGASCLGWWAVHAERTSDYDVILRRWPAEAGYAITAGIDGADVDTGPEGFIEPESRGLYRGGKALDIYGAALKIGVRSWYADIPRDADRVTFRVRLRKGPHTLRAWFSGGNNVHRDTVMSPYYVSIRASRGVRRGPAVLAPRRSNPGAAPPS